MGMQLITFLSTMFYLLLNRGITRAKRPTENGKKAAQD